jgi:hypothetical protein
VKILDPACGSGNFLYVALLRLKDLELEAAAVAAAYGWPADLSDDEILERLLALNLERAGG